MTQHGKRKLLSPFPSSHLPPWSAFCLLPLRPHCSTVQLQLLLLLLLLLLIAAPAVTRLAPRFLPYQQADWPSSTHRPIMPQNQQPTSSSTPESSATLQVPSSMTQEQNEQIFEIRRQQAEDERAAAGRKFDLELELMRRESDARIAASAAAVTAAATAAIQAPKRAGMEEDDIIGEIPPEVTNISLCFARLLQKEIVNLSQPVQGHLPLSAPPHARAPLQGLPGPGENRHRGRNVEIKEDLRNVQRLWKEFHEVWGEAFINYTAIIVSLFGKEAPTVHTALTQFYGNILQLSKVYEWQEAVLPMAIEVHTHIIAQQPSDPQKLAIPTEFQGRFCTPMTMIGMATLLGANKRKGSRSPPSRRVNSSSGSSNNPSVVCDLFNKGSCKFRLADASKPPLTKSPSSLVPSAWADLLHWLIASFLKWVLCHYLDRL